MSFRCKIGLHSWKGCKCDLCNQIRDVHHDWLIDSDKCSKCGKIIQHSHDLSNYSEKPSNTIKTVRIGNQIWMQENLNISKYRNGDEIPYEQDRAKWGELTTGAWCYQKGIINQEMFKYGKLYNWYAVNDERGLAPDGYHIPSFQEWTGLINYLGGKDDAFVKMRVLNNEYGLSKGFNSSGFTALLGGFINGNGEFGRENRCCMMWSSTAYDMNDSWLCTLDVFDCVVTCMEVGNNNGVSVRCLKD